MLIRGIEKGIWLLPDGKWKSSFFWSSDHMATKDLIQDQRDQQDGILILLDLCNLNFQTGL